MMMMMMMIKRLVGVTVTAKTAVQRCIF